MPERVQDMLDAITEIETFVGSLDKQEFLANRMAVRAVTLNLIIIGEAAAAVADALQDDEPGVPWHVMYGMRNRLVHGYFAVDEEILWDTVHRDLLPLKEQLMRLL